MHSGQVEVLELQSQPWAYQSVLTQTFPSCEKLHTLLLSGLLGMDLDLLATLPCLECLALNYCHADRLQGLSKLQHLRSGLAPPTLM